MRFSNAELSPMILGATCRAWRVERFWRCWRVAAVLLFASIKIIQGSDYCLFLRGREWGEAGEGVRLMLRRRASEINKGGAIQTKRALVSSS